jgi:hypothetical protein
MTQQRAIRRGVAALAAGAVVLGVGAAVASGNDASTVVERATKGGWPGRGVASVAEAERLAGVAGSKAETLILVARTVREADVDLPPENAPDEFSPGDFFLFEDRLFNSSGTRPVGRDSGRCEGSIQTFTCEATAQIVGKGKIRVAGSLFSESDAVFPVTGGTGAYEGVGGQISVFDQADGSTLLVFHLVR